MPEYVTKLIKQILYQELPQLHPANNFECNVDAALIYCPLVSQTSQVTAESSFTNIAGLGLKMY